MDRREFLKSIFALGVSLSLPSFDVSSASADEIDTAWEQLKRKPFYFEVSEWGALTTAGMDFPVTRGECRNLDQSDIASVDLLLAAVVNQWDIEGIVGRAYLTSMNAEGDEYEVPINKLIAWLNATPSNFEYAQEQVQAWMDDTDLDENDCEMANLRGNTGQGNALRFFRDGDLNNKALGIVIVEGDRPGSSYFAAELRHSIEDANAAAIELHLPFRFRAET